MIPLREAHRLLQHIPGYCTITSLKSRIRSGDFPYEKVGGRGEIWVLGPAVHEKIGMGKDEAQMTEDQKLIRHYEEDESNNYITATKSGLASTLGHAKRVYEEYLTSKTDPRFVAAKAKKTHEERLAHQELSCPECIRSYRDSREDSIRVTREVTGDRNIFTLAEEYALIELHEFRCPKCRQWRIPVPIERMRECLHMMHEANSRTPKAPQNPETPEAALVTSEAPTKIAETPADSNPENLVQSTTEIEQ
jgi:hypothetical protein